MVGVTVTAFTPAAMLPEYVVVPELKGGLNVPGLIVRPVRSSTVRGRALVTITV